MGLFETLGEAMRPDIDLGKSSETFFQKTMLKDRITPYLQELDPESSVMAKAIHGAIWHPENFDNLIDMIVSQHKDNPEGMTKVIGEVPMRLILKYNKQSS